MTGFVMHALSLSLSSLSLSLSLNYTLYINACHSVLLRIKEITILGGVEHCDNHFVYSTELKLFHRHIFVCL